MEQKKYLFTVDELDAAINEEIERQGLKEYEDILDYRSDYISDKISEYSDSKVDIYYSDLMEWLPDNTGWLEDAFNEFGWDGCGKDFYKAIQMAQFLAYEHECYDNIDKIIAAITYEKFRDMAYEQLDITDMTIEEVINSIDNVVNNCSNIDSITEIDEALIEEFGEIEDEE